MQTSGTAVTCTISGGGATRPPAPPPPRRPGPIAIQSESSPRKRDSVGRAGTRWERLVLWSFYSTVTVDPNAEAPGARVW